MSPPGGPIRWLHLLGSGGPRPEESAALEVEHHISELTDRLTAEGLTPDDARREAERRFGDRGRYERWIRRAEQRQRAVERWVVGLDVVRQSLRSVGRTARREPGFTAAVVMTLALGIGANATMYGIIDRLLLHGPEHVVEPQEVVRVMVERTRGSPGTSLTPFLAYPDYLDLRAHRGFTSVAAYFTFDQLTVGGGESASTASVAGAAAELFPLLGVQPLRGRFFTTAEAQPGSNPTAILGFEYWSGAFAKDPGAIGRRIEVEGVVYTIVGIAPPNFTGVDLRRIDIWIPLELTWSLQSEGGAEVLAERSFYGFNVVARLRSTALRDAAEAEATSLHRSARQEMINAGRYSNQARIVLGPLIASRGPDTNGSLWNWTTVAELRVAKLLAGVSMIVLLIACANVANLLLTRGTRRRREFSVRFALGAARSSVVTQAILEALVLALAGGVVALAFARWAGEIVRSTLFPDVFFPDSTLTTRAVLFTLSAALLAGLSAGLLPALQGVRRRHALGLQGHGLGTSRPRSTLRGVLTVAQAALSVALLVGAGLFLRSLQELRAIDLGFDADRLALVFFQYRNPPPDGARATELVLDAVERVAALPSVEAAAAASSAFPGYTVQRVRPEGPDSMPPLSGGGPYVFFVTPDYFPTVGLTITRGRGIEESDAAGGQPVAVVSTTMARTFWPGRDPVGECLLRPESERCAFRVVGVVEDAARTGFRESPSAAYYVPAAQATTRIGAIYVRARGDADHIVGEIARALGSFAPEVRNARVETVRDRLDPQARSWTLGATLFTIFGLLALIVAAIGLYSVLAFDVAQRTRELGIRTALGAQKSRLLRSVVARGVTMGGIGISVGLSAAYIAAPYLQDLLFETSPRDPWVLGGVGSVLLIVSVVASLAPALRATRVDPMVALKTD